MNQTNQVKKLKLLKSAILVCLLAQQLKIKNKNKISKKRNRRYFRRLDNADRSAHGFYEVSFKNIQQNEDEFFKHTRMTKETFEFLLSLLKKELTKRKTKMTITAEERLVITLSYLSQGVSHEFLGWSFKIGRSTARAIIIETCDIVWQILSPLYVSEPNIQDYYQIAQDYQTKWNLPNCVGAIDGKHISIECPPHSGSEFYNYNKFYSVVLLAACDAHYIFTMVDIGAYGSQSDGGILSQSTFGKKLFSGELPLPDSAKLPNTEIKCPYYFIGDPAFPLKENLFRAYPGKNLLREKKIFNYRLSRGRVTIKNAFGILVARWRVLRTTLNCHPKNAEKIVLATVALHNFLMLNKISKSKYCPPFYIDAEDIEGNVIKGQWRKDVKSTAFYTQRLGSNNTTRNIFKLRDTLMEYFNKEAAIPLQNKIKHICNYVLL